MKGTKASKGRKITHFLNETALILSMGTISLLAVGIIGGLIWVFSKVLPSFSF